MANSNSQPTNPVLIIRLRKSAVGKKENGAFTTRHHPVGLATDVATANAVCKDMNAHKESEKEKLETGQRLIQRRKNITEHNRQLIQNYIQLSK